MNDEATDPVIPNEREPHFPPLGFDLRTTSDLVAIGGHLSSSMLREAYSKGLFPWYNEGEPVLWHSPEPRLVLQLSNRRFSKSLSSLLRKGVFSASWDGDFEGVVEACAGAKRQGQDGTWIHADMKSAYKKLHEEGVAHSVEVRLDGGLVGGLYGLVVGSAFFGESMFHRVANASKVAFAHLVQKSLEVGIGFIDCQTAHAQHLKSFGAAEHSRAEFHSMLAHSNRRTIPKSLLASAPDLSPPVAARSAAKSGTGCE